MQSRIDALQGARARQSRRRAAAGQPAARLQAKFVAKRRDIAGRARRLRGRRATRASAIRNRALDDLDVWLEIFERNATRARRDGAVRRDAGGHQLRWCWRSRRSTASRRSSSRSRWCPEESALDHAIEAAGLTVVETDLGEYILQINNYEPPSHIIGPALHKSQGGGRRPLRTRRTARRSRRDRGAAASRRAACCASTISPPTWAFRAAISSSPRPARSCSSPTRATRR